MEAALLEIGKFDSTTYVESDAYERFLSYFIDVVECSCLADSNFVRFELA